MSQSSPLLLPLPGAIGNPDITISSDPRADARMVEAMAAANLTGKLPTLPVNVNSSLEEIYKFAAEAESQFSGLFKFLAMAPSDKSTMTEETIISPHGGHEIKLFIHTPKAKPTNADGKYHGIIHIHGGGMAILTAEDERFTCNPLSAMGVVVISIEFRNAAGKLGPHPFPAGLTDCIDAIVHIANHKSKFNIGKIVLLGASGGGNLILASALKLKKDNNHIVDGVYACCPYISGRTEPGTNPPLISLVENPFFVDPKFMSVVIKLYNLNNPDEKDPLAWPMHATVEELKGFPPTKIVLDELDPLRDEGLEMYRKLNKAGCKVQCVMMMGMVHAGEFLIQKTAPEVFFGSLKSVVDFADLL